MLYSRNLNCFRLLTEYHSFLFKNTCNSFNLFNMFPSPYGVSFILIIDEKGYNLNAKIEFPSPYGVSFILIRK